MIRFFLQVMRKKLTAYTFLCIMHDTQDATASAFARTAVDVCMGVSYYLRSSILLSIA